MADSVTAQKIKSEFRVSTPLLEVFNAPIFPALERDNPTQTLYTEAGKEINVEGLTADTIVLRNRKVKRNTFIAVGS